MSAPMRVVSLLPSLTEIVCALGAGERLVGRSHECDHPPAVAKLPVLTAPRFAGAGDASGDVDARVRALLADALSVFTVDVARLRALAPDLILTQDQCRACAVSLRDVEAALEVGPGRAPRVLSVAPGSLGEVFEAVRRLASALELAAEGERLLAGLGARITAIGEQRGRRAAPPRVAVIEWLDPLMAAGHWLPELVAIAGGEALLAQTGRPSRWIAFEALRAADPDVIVVAPCGYPLATTRRELSRLTALPGWHALRAVRGAQVYLADGSAYFNRPGPRLLESLEILAEILAPATFSFGHEGRGFERL